MKVLKTVSQETVHTIEITEKELNTLVIGMGNSTDRERRDTAERYGVPILERHEAQMLYSTLHDRQLVKK